MQPSASGTFRLELPRDERTKQLLFAFFDVPKQRNINSIDYLREYTQTL